MTLSLRKNGPVEGQPLGVRWADWGDFDRLFDTIAPLAARRGTPAYAGAMNPAVELTHDQNEIILRAEVPGIAKEDIELTVHDDTLTLKGNKRGFEQKAEGAYHYTERSYGEFTRSFSLPFPVDTSKIQASMKDGILEARLPVAEAARPQKVEIG